MVGQCKLCLKEDNLKESHFIPAGIYRRLRDKNEKNPNPFFISNKKAVQTSKQKWAHLLCNDCEQRLNKDGENWVLGNCVQKDGSFPLMSVLASRSPDVSSPNNPTKIYNASNIPEINISALAYFAASIFWRGSIYTWNNDGSIPVTLGPFQEQFRKYLLGLEDFPMHCSLLVIVREGKEADRITYGEPTGGRHGNVHRYNFAMPGLAFTLITSKNVPANFREKCFVRGSGNPVIVTTIIDKLLMDSLLNRLRKHSSAK
jgi:hypothetical protein